MRILISDDDLTSRSMLAAVLKKSGHDVVETRDGTQAWEELQKSDAPKLAILDWMMPGMDGVEVVRRVRTIPSPEPPYIIMLTANCSMAHVVAGLDAGADEYLAKPFDISELHARLRVAQRVLGLQEALARQASHDPLTHALNRRGILDALDKEIVRAARTSTTLSIGMCDIDHFKLVNDTHGHLAGDDVLSGVVQCIQGGLRDYDLIGRYGGEEFLVVAPGSAGTPGEGLYQRLCAAVAKSPIVSRDGSIAVTVSIGVAVLNGADAAPTLLAAADAALYRAKDEGRNRVVYAAGA